MSSTPSRIELTCEFIPSILSGPIGFVTFVCCRHLFGIGFLLRIGFVRRVGSGHYETWPNGSSSRCAGRRRGRYFAGGAGAVLLCAEGCWQVGQVCGQVSSPAVTAV